MEVIGVHNPRAADGTEKLTKPEYWYLFPGELSEDREGQSDGGIKMSTRAATRKPHPERQTARPAEVNGKKVLLTNQESISHGYSDRERRARARLLRWVQHLSWKKERPDS